MSYASNETVCRFLVKFFKMKFKIRLICLKGYSSGESHFSEINVRLAEENEFATHFVQKCLEVHENEQKVVLNESSGGSA